MSDLLNELPVPTKLLALAILFGACVHLSLSIIRALDWILKRFQRCPRCGNRLSWHRRKAAEFWHCHNCNHRGN